MLTGRRAPAGTNNAKGRPHLGTPAMGNSASHSHIRIIPRSDIEDPTALYDYDEYDDWLPTYRSSSFLHSAIGNTPTQPVESPQSAPKTFADMARRIHFGDLESGSEPLTQAPAPIGGTVKFQASRKPVEGSWRPFRPSHPQAHSSEQEDDDVLITHGAEQIQSLRSAADTVLPITQGDAADMVDLVKHGALPRTEYSAPSTHKSTGHGLFTLPDNLRTSETSMASANVNDQYTELFGKLPDQIRLHEQTGEFDGQVIFIGHPNRDVSAHQWSANSFQWVNIGRYAHARGRVEGSLASDQVQGADAPSSALAQFKLAAQDREKVILDAERHEEGTASFQPSISNISHVGSVGTTHAGIYEPPYSFRKTTSPLQSRETIRKEPLDDPFVVNVNQIQARLMHSGAKVAEIKGSLDFEYKFPENGPAARIQARIPMALAAHTRDSAGLPRGQTAGGKIARSSLRDTDVGEEASSQFPSVVGQSILPRRIPDRIMPEAAGLRPQLTGQLIAGSEHLKYTDQGGPSVPRFQAPQVTARSLFPPPGLTVANPRRDAIRLAGTSLANLTIAPGGMSSKSLALAGSVPDIDPSTAIRYSDTDVIREVGEREIVSGLSHQPPTVQNLKGPFFAVSKPTANDPTASLSVQVSEEETLRSWFQDGHRPARQREYAMTLISTAPKSSKSRQLGAIGDAKDQTKSSGMENTRPFVRLYETLAEYVEEYKNGSGGSYFTRAWKPAPAYLRDFGPDSNNSFFSK